MGVPSPVRHLSHPDCSELDPVDTIDGKSVAALREAQISPSAWEANHLVIPVCIFAGGPPVARHLAAASKAFHRAICRGWADLEEAFLCRLYVVGGLDRDYRPVETVERYDPLLGYWETLPPLQTARAGACAVVAAGRLYIIGGEVSGRALGDAQRFDPGISRWEMLPSLGAGRIRAAGVDGGNYVFVLGGLDGTRPMSSVERYDPQSRIWQEMPPMQCPRYACIAAAQGQWIFAFGGELTESGMLASMERFDYETGFWELLPAVQSPCCGSAMTLAASGRAALVLGGLSLSGQALSVAKQLSLDPLLASSRDELDKMDLPRWSCLPPMPTPRHLASAATFCGGAIAVGGKGAKFEATHNVEFFNPDVWAWEVLPHLPSPRFRAAVAGGHL